MRPMPSKVPFPRVAVIWQDAEADPSWLDLSQIEHNMTVSLATPNRSEGRLIKKTPKWVVLASTFSWNGEWSFSNLMSIPAAMVRKIERL